MTACWPIYRLSVAQYERMTAAGFLHEDQPVELLEGCLVPKMPKHPLHDSTVDLLAAILAAALPEGWFLRVQNSLVTEDSVPEPDLAVIAGKPGDFRTRHPEGPDTRLVIEVADSSVDRDRAKAAIYARAGVPEYWIINLQEWRVERMTQPDGAGQYAVRATAQSDDVLTIGLGDHDKVSIPLDELLTPPA
jgi:Uma2 family endonuclease